MIYSTLMTFSNQKSSSNFLNVILLNLQFKPKKISFHEFGRIYFKVLHI